jgi:hypothetical protein
MAAEIESFRSSFSNWNPTGLVPNQYECDPGQLQTTSVVGMSLLPAPTQAADGKTFPALNINKTLRVFPLAIRLRCLRACGPSRKAV